MILLLAEGRSYADIQAVLQTSAPTITRWKKRFVAQGIAGLFEMHHPGQKPSVITAQLQARVLEATRRKPKDGSTHCSVRKLAAELQIGKDAVHRIWKKAGVKPHRLDRYMASNDPDFESKAADVIGLYLNPPQHAAVFCVDEKSAIQALDRLDPVLPLSPGRVERHGFEYYRHGTLSLYAAIDVKTGKVHGKTAARHTSDELVDFLDQVVRLCQPKQEIHIIVDNLSAHKTKQVAEFLGRTPGSKTALHADLLFVVESGRELVRPHRTRRNCTRCIYLRPLPRAETHVLHPNLLQERQALSLEVLRCHQTHQAMLTNSLRHATRCASNKGAKNATRRRIGNTPVMSWCSPPCRRIELLPSKCWSVIDCAGRSS
jgi:transposase